MTVIEFEQAKSFVPEKYLDSIRQNMEFEMSGFFQDITTPNDVADFQQWARENYKPEMDINSIWHPIVVAECIQMIKEFKEGNGVQA